MNLVLKFLLKFCFLNPFVSSNILIYSFNTFKIPVHSCWNLDTWKRWFACALCKLCSASSMWVWTMTQHTKFMTSLIIYLLLQFSKLSVIESKGHLSSPRLLHPVPVVPSSMVLICILIMFGWMFNSHFNQTIHHTKKCNYAVCTNCYHRLDCANLLLSIIWST